MDNKERIIRASRILKRICTLLVFLVPVICALYWIFFNQVRHLPNMTNFPVPITGDLPAFSRLLAFFIDLIPSAVLVYGLFVLARLFALYENGIIFAKANVDCFNRLGRAMIVWVVCHFVNNSLISIAVTLHHPPGQRIITVGLEGADFGTLFVGGVVLTVTWVMDEARKIKEDHELFI